jgi:hypothetical protein
MRTAFMLGVPLHALRGTITQISHRAFTETDIARIQDEAVAHGMTLSAEIVEKTNSYNIGQQNILLLARDNLKSARDNKVWRNETK